MENNYRTKDLAESSFLLAKGKQLLSIERQGKVCWFVYENKIECEELVNEFLFGNSTISAKTFYEAIQTLKHKIFS
jgi:hypothetical protein